MRSMGQGALVLTAGCLLLGGCAEDGGERAVTLPPTTAASTPTTASSPPSVTPTVAAEVTPTPTTTLVLPDEHVESVDAFVVAFFDALNAAKDSGDFSAFDALYLPQCAGCAELRAELQGWLADGQTVEGGDWVILQQSSTQFQDGSKAAADVFAFRREASLAGEAGRVVAAETGVELFQLGLLAGDPWIIEQVGRTQLSPL